MAICGEIRLKLLQILLQMYKYTMFMNKYVLQKVLHEVAYFCCRNEKMIKNYLLQVVASSIYCKLQQPATGNFLSFFHFCNRNVQTHAILSATHIYSRTCYIYTSATVSATILV